MYMTHLFISLAGIVATLAMTIFAELAFLLMNRPYHVVRVLANMMRFKSTTPLNAKPFPELILAGILHFAIGILFAYGYRSFAIWVSAWSLPAQAMTFGIFIGIIAIAGWRIFFKFHPGPPPVYLPVYLSIIGVGHLVFAFTLLGVMSSVLFSF